jgi:phosphoribosyl-ATP pyrophosphohydrolase
MSDRVHTAEESAEVLLAAKGGNRDQLVYETADLWFHSLVVLAAHGIRPEEITRELGRRIGKQKPDYASPSGDPPQGLNPVDNFPPQA